VIAGYRHASRNGRNRIRGRIPLRGAGRLFVRFIWPVIQKRQGTRARAGVALLAGAQASERATATGRVSDHNWPVCGWTSGSVFDISGPELQVVSRQPVAHGPVLLPGQKRFRLIHGQSIQRPAGRNQPLGTNKGICYRSRPGEGTTPVDACKPAFCWGYPALSKTVGAVPA
jgi:hypothetical protein